MAERRRSSKPALPPHVPPSKPNTLRPGGEPPQCPLWVKSRHLQCKKACPLTPKSGHVQCTRVCRLWANSGQTVAFNRDNLLTKAIGVTFPPALIVAADEVID
jgi:hypothetical protein